MWKRSFSQIHRLVPRVQFNKSSNGGMKPIAFGSMAAAALVVEPSNNVAGLSGVKNHEGPRNKESFPAEFQHIFDADKKYIEVNLNKYETHFIHNTLKSSGEAVKELKYYYSEDKSHVVAICVSGTAVSGHPGVNHGGYTAAILDNTFGLLAFLNLTRPVTKSLTLNYKLPILANTTMIISIRPAGPAEEVVSVATGRARKEQKYLAQVFEAKQTKEGTVQVSKRPNVESEAVFVDVSNVAWGNAQAGAQGSGH